MSTQPWRLPGYLVETQIGAGSSGAVWRARVRSSGAAVALKRIPLTDPAQWQAAVAEAALLGALDHPHLVHLHEIVRSDDAMVLVLDLAAGGSLARLLAARGRLAPGEVITAIAPIAAALAHAHLAGVVHGDVSAANVLFTESGLPLLADLGVARLLGDRAPARSTPAYIDPAIAAGSLPGPASDVFMVAAVALHALTGQPLWPGDDPALVLEAAASATGVDAAARLADVEVPEQMARVLSRALTFAPERRGTAAELALDLRHSGQPVAVELGAGAEPADPADLRTRRRPPPASAPSGRPLTAPSRPAFERPAGLGDPAMATGGSPAFTHGARVSTPFPDRGAHRRGREARGVLRRLRVPLGATGAALLVLTAVFWWPSGAGHRPAGAPAAAAGMVPSIGPAGSSEAPPGPVATSRGARPRPVGSPSPNADPAALDAPAVAQLLSDLDAVRAAAFARRDPALLAQIYAPGRLQSRDRALLAAVVPAGCSLRGVRTSFSDVRVLARDPDRVRIRVRATLAPSRLICVGRLVARAPGSAAVTLRIELVRSAGGYRIGEQRSAAPVANG